MPCGSKGLAWKPDGSRLVWDQLRNNFVIWDVATADRVQVLEGSDVFGFTPKVDLVWSADGTQIAGFYQPPFSNSGAGSVRFWDANSGKVLRTVPLARVEDGKLNPSLTQIAGLKRTDEGSVQVSLLNSSDGTLIRTFDLKNFWTKLGYPQFEFSGDGSRLVVMGYELAGAAANPARLLKARVWETATGAVVRDVDHIDSNFDGEAHLNTDGTRLILLDGRSYSTAPATPNSELILLSDGSSSKLPGLIAPVTMTADRGKFTTLKDGALEVWDASQGTRLNRLALPATGQFRSDAVQTSSAGSLAAVLSRVPTGCELQLLNATSGAALRPLGRGSHQQLEVKLNLQASGPTAAYTLAGTAQINGLAFSVSGAGIVTSDSKVISNIDGDAVDAEWEKLHVNMDLKDSSNNIIWQIRSDEVRVTYNVSTGEKTADVLNGVIRGQAIPTDKYAFSFVNSR